MLSAEASVGYSTEPLEHPKRYILTLPVEICRMVHHDRGYKQSAQLSRPFLLGLVIPGLALSAYPFLEIGLDVSLLPVLASLAIGAECHSGVR